MKKYTHVPMLCELCKAPLAVGEKSILQRCRKCEWKSTRETWLSEMRLTFYGRPWA